MATYVPSGTGIKSGFPIYVTEQGAITMVIIFLVPVDSAILKFGCSAQDSS